MKPPTETQLAALARFASTGQMTTDGRVVAALIRRGLVVRQGKNAYSLTNDGRTLLNRQPKSGAFRSHKPMTCIVDGCNRTVYSQYNMCDEHLQKWLDGLLPPRSRQEVSA